jgi:hypothetical protein
MSRVGVPTRTSAESVPSMTAAPTGEAPISSVAKLASATMDARTLIRMRPSVPVDPVIAG